MAKKIPLRICTGCGESKPKKELIRVLRTPEEEVCIDASGKKNGRGAYICLSADCLQKAINSRGLERSLKMPIPNELIDTLKKELVSLESDIKKGV
ncbi:MAG: YlxR family protein [Clostridiales bacterium]|nr:YlxR family protein [Clostridiales bacterium]